MSKKATAKITQTGVHGKDGKEYEVGAEIDVTLTKNGALPSFLCSKAVIVEGGKAAVTNPKKLTRTDMVEALKAADISVAKDTKVAEVKALYDELMSDNADSE